MPLRTAPVEAVRSDGVLSKIHFLPVGPHIAGNDALRHRFGAGQFIAIYIGLVLVRISLGKRRPHRIAPSRSRESW